ncbi:acyl-CoA synthetase FdrA [Avibacterium sp. 21-599]|uniref:acyl-CoA synthetase FdrA n=1 Tax=Avibacterium sp. 21-599 TaxID=2911528 RepID=UPI0022484930|nr:acyl-CoA synthetase FdrA [Avibacterium sp. 21-599]MCW9718124.1 acyl-CoA synthetase FdrA [Avibacterium sp. 21-599]
MITAAIKSNCFQDSVSLMIISKTLSAMESVKQVSVMMGTPANKDLFKTTGLWHDLFNEATPNDICIAIETMNTADSEVILAEVSDALDNELANIANASRGKKLPTVRSWARAEKALPDANIALISIAGEYASGVANQALDKGLNVMMFSDNVSIEDEIALKQKAKRKNLIVMGPDCGTSYIAGIPLAFANKMPKGNIGIVGASGTGIQELCSQIALAGSGITHAIGLGGRDLSEKVGGISAEMALDLLENDENTQVITFVSKPPAPNVRLRIIEKMQSLTKPVVAIFLGDKPEQKRLSGGVHLAYTLDEAAKSAVHFQKVFSLFKQLGKALTFTSIRGLYTGGTLAAEAAMLLADALDEKLETSHDKGLMFNAQNHKIIDLGDDFYTVGRPHPMIDPSTRTDQILALKDDSFGILLVDVVLGYGSCADPAKAVIEAVTSLRKQKTEPFVVIATVTGTDQDPQNRQAQIQALEAEDIIVANSVQEAVDMALIAGQLSLTTHQGFSQNNLLAEPKVINIGLTNFAEDLLHCQAAAIHYRWAPIAGGNAKMIQLLNKLS